MHETISGNLPLQMPGKNTPLKIKPVSSEITNSENTDEIVGVLDIDGVAVEVVRRNDKTIYRLPGNMSVKDLDPNKRTHVIDEIQKLHLGSQKPPDFNPASQSFYNIPNNIATNVYNPSGFQNPQSVPTFNFGYNYLPQSIQQLNNLPNPITPIPNLNNTFQNTQYIDTNIPVIPQTSLTTNLNQAGLIAIKPRVLLPSTSLSSITPKISNDPSNIPQATPKMPFGLTGYNTPIPEISPMNLQNLFPQISSDVSGFSLNPQKNIPLPNNYIPQIPQHPNPFSQFKTPKQTTTPKATRTKKSSKPLITSKKSSLSSELNNGVKDKIDSASFNPYNIQVKLAPNNINGNFHNSLNNNNLKDMSTKLYRFPSINNFPQIPLINNQLSSGGFPISAKKISSNNINKNERFKPFESSPGKHISSPVKQPNTPKQNQQMMYKTNGLFTNSTSPLHIKRTLNGTPKYSKDSNNLGYINKFKNKHLKPKQDTIKKHLKKTSPQRLITDINDIFDLGSGIKPADLISDNLSKPSNEYTEHCSNVKKKFESVLTADHSSLSRGNSTLQTPFRNLPDIIQRLLPYHVHAGVPITDDEVKNYHQFVSKSESVLISRISNIESRIKILQTTLDDKTEHDILHLCLEKQRLEFQKGDKL
ncbi:hypothetical protein AYI70_g11162 [Smittium culicis]|uniref:GLTSCR protein conserved domain-containing protein n=1 Tax=Smittium culicis TaxID=133412 RepID=A0A1R1X317_9FUNG|nr:hypothetical protein AYI70_g11162 [Smittium culicis]